MCQHRSREWDHVLQGQILDAERYSGFTDCARVQVVVDEALLAEVLGPRRFLGHDTEHRVAEPGSVAGLVWTEAGGQVQYVECAATSPGRPGHRCQHSWKPFCFALQLPLRRCPGS
jgi:ATP-dependent Lon protease